ncbi:multiple sugar transport system ATP-binding protein [Rhizobium binae]|uniref:Multiple sugar transport system ATP-binding protein n=1 Tax=Rhizobium binae TaxID=1138190 RepID=A0ABV2MQ31_9HYPH|nr:ABC transporter ATP-binding protein [Rhizobium binae]MBX4970010.1 ABC transporter ATP-binding protein [Rhizobium binae]MBX4994893.1 ABC transporter ATP-binding protein [Rhizobium binae]NKL51682.1 ATP-binding cassette domain-containing protein [Rhizobium leguminosarum bv. viciae]QSY84983.1 ABC transporter ATP-binding protein [Rhizobium binae]
MSSISFKNVTKSFGAKEVIRDIDFTVDDGEFLVLLGPSGCGKSTLLRMLAGLEAISSGEIVVGERRVDRLPPGQRDMAFVFQSYALYPHLSVRRNMTFPLLMQQFHWWYHLPVIGRMARNRIENGPDVVAKVEKTARILALTEMLDRFPRTLSGGQRQRVALGRAMVREPQVFLMDEPLSNLDAKLRTSMRSEITALHREIGGTFVYVTHDQVEAMTMGTRIALMRDGVIQQFGTAREIYTDPANTYVARFIGTPPMNLIHARLSQDTVTFGGSQLRLPQTFGAPADILFGIRPNAISIGPKAGATPGRVVMVEHIGAESVIGVRLDEARTAHEADQSIDAVMITVPGYTDLTVDDVVGLSFDPTQAVVFAATTGERLRG